MGGMDSVICAVVRGTECAGSGEAVAVLARHSEASGSKVPVCVVRVAALASAAPRRAFREALFPADPNLHRQVQECVRRCMGDEEWQQLAVQASGSGGGWRPSKGKAPVGHMAVPRTHLHASA